jgi:hypothetical protein
VKKLMGEFLSTRVTDKKTAWGVKASSASEAILLDGDGDEIHRDVFSSAAALARVLEEALRRYGPKEIAWATPGGKLPERERRPVVTVFVDDRKESTETLRALEDRTVAKHHGRFLFVQAAFRRDSEEARKWGVTQAPALVAADPESGEVLERISGRRGSREIKAFLLKSLSRLEKK